MSDIALEIRTDDASEYPLSNMIGAGGPSPARLHIYEVRLAYGQWEPVQAYLDQQKLPYKYACPSDAEFAVRNNPDW
ncbi:hypothetical protein [Paraburkholderia youngii]|uniref:hypothetical protein n=1 Tax=Paraburkholderia youngii TaxID=2782701 RepID=UPI003D1E5E1D